MAMLKRIILSIVLVAVLAAPGYTRVPQLLNYQGVLTDAGGAVVSDGSYNLTFRIYDVATGGAALWSETQPVQVTKGVFNAQLGVVSTLDLPFDQGYWLGISVEGETELTPRVRFSSSAYSLNSRAVRGWNVFPDSGRVGINTDIPGYPLDVYAGTANQVGLNVHGSDPDWASIYVSAEDSGARPGYGYVRGSLLAQHYVDTDGDWNLRVGAVPSLSVTSAGDVGIGVSSPLERLEVNGAVKIGAASGLNAGTIRWSGTDFEGYDGSQWVSLTGAGSSGLPSGSSGQTLRHDGSDWTAAGNLYNDGSFVGVGTDTPGANLHIMSTGNPAARVESGLATGSAGVMAKTEGGSQDYAMLQKMGSSVSGSKVGIPFANLSLLQIGSQAGALMVDMIPPEPIHFVIDNSEIVRMTGAGELKVYNDGNAAASIYSSSDGGRITLYDEAGNYHTEIRPTPSGSGGYLSMRRDDTHEGIRLEGDKGGTSEPFFKMAGSAREVEFDMADEGDFSVVLPVNSIARNEIKDEPGVASMTYSETEGIGLSMGSYVALGSRSITVPAAGYVMVMATSSIHVNHTNGSLSTAQFGVSHAPDYLNPNQRAELGEPAAAATGVYERIVSSHGLYEVIDAGTATFNFLGYLTGGSMTAYDVQLTLCYFPTPYGTVEPTAAVSPALATAPDRAEREKSIADNQARIERELAAMKSRVAELEQELKAQ